jgi:hypothetical protein
MSQRISVPIPHTALIGGSSIPLYDNFFKPLKHFAVLVVPRNSPRI